MRFAVFDPQFVSLIGCLFKGEKGAWRRRGQGGKGGRKTNSEKKQIYRLAEKKRN